MLRLFVLLFFLPFFCIGQIPKPKPNTYKALAIAGKKKMIFRGEFIIGLLLNSVGFHSIKDIFIEGIHID
jgi:hypothetical protein